MGDQLVVITLRAEQALYTGLTLYAVGWLLVGVLITVWWYLENKK